jgi:tRNA modification GTPase
MRDSTDEIEKEGIRRSRETLESAELILHVVDHSAPREIAPVHFDQPAILVLNKSDLPHAFESTEGVEVSCTTGNGLEKLKDRIGEIVWSGAASQNSSDVTINTRHEEALLRAKEGISNTITAMIEGASIELAAMDLRLAVNAIGEIVGKTTTEDLLDAIFSQFCIGK